MTADPDMATLEDVAELMATEIERLELNLEMWRLSPESDQQRAAIKSLVKALDERQEALSNLRQVLRATSA